MLLVSSKEPTLSLFSVLACTFFCYSLFNELISIGSALHEKTVNNLFYNLPQAGFSKILFSILALKKPASRLMSAPVFYKRDCKDTHNFLICKFFC